jgi:hypothetical protein
MMKPEHLPPASSLSLQSKLDLIAHDLDVLALLRWLAAQGLCEGDRVRHTASGEIGYLNVTREDDMPCAVVVLPSGSRAAFDPGWQRA